MDRYKVKKTNKAMKKNMPVILGLVGVLALIFFVFIFVLFPFLGWVLTFLFTSFMSPWFFCIIVVLSIIKAIVKK